MKKISLIIFLATIYIFSNAQNEESILIGKKASIFSNILKANRNIWIYHNFKMNGNKAAVFTFVQSEGVFKAILKE